MISDSLAEYLASVEDGHTQWARSHAEQTAAHLEAVGIERQSAISELYTRFGWALKTRVARYELLSPDELAETTRYVQEEFDVPRRFIALTSIEGEGVVLLDRNNSAVFDVRYGQFEDLENNTLEPIAQSQEEFLEWYYGDTDWGKW